MLEPRRYVEWLHEHVFQPVIVVIGTDTVKKRVKDTTGLTLGELLSPFGGSYRWLSANYTSLERPMRMEGVRVRFSDADSSSQWTNTQADQISTYTVERAAPKDLEIDEKLSLKFPTPWFVQWRLSLFRALRWSEHEGLDQPTAVMLVVSSKESDPIYLLENLLHASNMPPLCTQGVLDPVPARAAVLLHDHSDPDSPAMDELNAKFDLVRARFTPHMVVLMEINRGSAPLKQIQEMYHPLVLARGVPPPPESGDGTVGLCQSLTHDDLESLSSAASEVILQCAFPWMERQLQGLEAQISHSRKGLKNQLKYLWRKPREASGTSGGGGAGGGSGMQAALSGALSLMGDAVAEPGSVYPLHSVEGQMRLAGDLAFHLRDYETAAGYYRTIVGDFKQDRAWKHAAGAYEIWGLCAYMTGTARSEWERVMESAYENYIRASAPRHALRVVALHQMMICDSRESAARLIRVNTDIADTSLSSALILEQAAQRYFDAGLKRKGAFYMILAGFMFNKLGLKRLAFCAYRASADLYSRRWFEIGDHCQFTMARQAFGLGMYRQSLDHFLALLNSFAATDKHVTIQADRESTYLKEFVFVVKTWIEKCKPTEAEQRLALAVPRIAENVQVVLPANAQQAVEAEMGIPPPPASPTGMATPWRTGGAVSAAAAAGDYETSQVALPSWEALGTICLGSSLKQDDKLELQCIDRKADRQYDSLLQRCVAVGTEITLALELTNPLRVPLDLSNAKCVGQLTPHEQGADPENAGEDTVDFPAVTLTLAPLETRKVQLAAVPKKVGMLRIQAISWTLREQVQCWRQLDIKGRRLQSTKKERASKEGIYSVDRRLEFHVKSSMPRVEASLEGWPESSEENLLHGELRKLDLVLTGCAGSPGHCGAVHGLRIATSHPTVLCLRSADCSPSVSEKGGVIHVGKQESGEAAQPHKSLADVVRIPMLLRGDAPGSHGVRICIAADHLPEDGKEATRQWVCLRKFIQVRRSVACSARQSPSFAAERGGIFMCSFENRAAQALTISSIRLSAPGRATALTLQHCSKDEKSSGYQLESGQVVSMTLSVPTSNESVKVPTTPFLSASRQAREKHAEGLFALSASAESKLANKKGGDQASDLLVEWVKHNSDGSVAGTGEVYIFDVPKERSGAPCPLEMRLHAPESSTPCEPYVPVSLHVQNTADVGEVSFYVVADSSQDFMWLGCERSAIVKLAPGASYSNTLYACFPIEGIFNLNRLRFHVVGLPRELGGMPASEHAPLAFSFSFERLIHIKSNA
eukprot:TRINITY_DN12768_c0_g1_i2.p1 TRINITY_DN12768_c0_g1~~TRINITY_DN12768_c0_g1_i2.p1  ORF type:complete len:1272 (-),score=208.97 TRINITY_DN12768_c0_g1_i2:409-4224(-)